MDDYKRSLTDEDIDLQIVHTPCGAVIDVEFEEIHRSVCPANGKSE